MPDELDKLFISNEELNKGVLFEILDNKIKITDEKDILIIGNFQPIKKIILYGLAKKVMFLKKIINEENIGPKEVSEKTGLPEGTSKVYVRKLEGMGFLMRKGNKYVVPNFALIKIKEYFEEDGKIK